MIYTIVGTNSEIRKNAYDKLAKLGEASRHIYSEQISELEPLIEASSMFGDKTIVNLLQTMDLASSREEVVRLLDKMKESSNIFIIDEPFADTNRITRLKKYSEELFNAKEEKKKDVDVFTLCNYFAKRDKKNAWVEWMRVRDLVDSKEAIHGALWWKFQTVWGDVLSGRSKVFTKKECEEIY